MTIKLRFALLLSLLLGGFLLAVLVLRGLERAEMRERLDADRQARAQFLNHWIDLTSRSLPQFVSDLAQSDDVAAMFAASDAEVTRKKNETSLAAAGVSSLWLVGADGAVAWHATAPGGDVAAPLPLAAADFVALVAETPSPRFFSESAGELIEVSVRRIQVAARPRGAEWIVAARRWDDAQLHALAGLTEARVSLRPAHENAQVPVGDAPIVLVRPLNDWRGHPLRVLRVEAQSTEIDQAIRADWRQVLIFVAFGLLVIGAMALALQQWVLHPLRHIGHSLATENPQTVTALATERSELGRVAQLVVEAFAQRESLQREIEQRARAQEARERSEAALRRNLEERARLGRDLHDGVIQSLYAAGMGLAGIRTLLKSEQTDAAVRLEQTRAALNETIHDVRNFIIGLEPEALKLQTFAQAVAAMLEVIRSMRAFRSTIDIDEAIASRLSLAQRVHALQITREAVSNALRHGHADSVHVALRPHGEFVEFEVSDDGSGFDAAGVVSQGKGLANFAARARELGGELEVISEPGRGTRVRLVFSPVIL